MGKKRNAYKVLARKPKGKISLEDLETDGTKILKFILKE
jgi:hypothetical protein